MTGPGRLGRTAVLSRIPVLLAGLLVVAACGAPGDGSTRAVADEDVPYRLLQPAVDAPAPSTGPPGSSLTVPQVFLVDPEGQLVARPLEVPTGDAGRVAAAALAALAGGPTDSQRSAGLSTALGPEARVDLVDALDGTARVELDVSSSALSADRLPLALGQVVLTAVSVQGIDRVLLLRDGEPATAPLPGGEQTSRPLVAADYAPLLAAGARPLKASTSPGP